jgi:hypothetical protein
MKSAVDSLSDEQKKDRDAVYKALGSAIERYIETLLNQLVIVIPPTPALGISVPGLSGGPTLPGPAPVPLPPGVFK